jgi:predicted cupin superfamily sugar epimerase
MTVEEVISILKLQPHPVEGGFFREIYRSSLIIPKSALPDNPGDRSLCTTIYYLLTAKTVSELHQLPTAEIFHFYLGSPVEMLQLSLNGESRRVYLGTDLKSGQVPQLVVPGGVWQGSHLCAGGEFALLGATMAPGFDYADYTSGNRKELLTLFPAEAELIKKLTPGQD